MTGKATSAIILAGGKGTRLRDKVSDRPKPMAEVQGHPFLEYALALLDKQGIRRTVLAVGYMHEKIVDHFGSKWGSMEIRYSIENEPLGTGGAFRLGLSEIDEESFFALNGDSLLDVSFEKMRDAHKTPLTLALKRMPGSARYGSVAHEAGRVREFREKSATAAAQPEMWINGGVYLVNRSLFDRFKGVEKFSFETDLLEKSPQWFEVNGVPTDGFFLDIGIPEDFERAQTESFFRELLKGKV